MGRFFRLDVEVMEDLAMKNQTNTSIFIVKEFQKR
jgi:hypothetical protein